MRLQFGAYIFNEVPVFVRNFNLCWAVSQPLALLGLRSLGTTDVFGTCCRQDFYEAWSLSWLYLIIYICTSAHRLKQTAPLSTTMVNATKNDNKVFIIYISAGMQKACPEVMLRHVVRIKQTVSWGWVLSLKIICSFQPRGWVGLSLPKQTDKQKAAEIHQKILQQGICQQYIR